MIDVQYKEFFMTLYKECHNSAKEQAVRRDQVIAFYIVICSFYLNWKDQGNFAK